MNISEHGQAAQLRLVFFQHLWAVEANRQRVAARQSAATRCRACLLDRFLARAFGPGVTLGGGTAFPQRSGKCVEQDHATDELLS